ncbi:TatD family hydrolase [Chryseolinea sp. H1M3-3]|uniref:TatD family hydrolase n=1 Tax=Chryseolinea sp. H1M3-3 TaxID=3034144 RepID=UPI0023EB4585|nr:TatD family hydrolase [Chryseolinea sp. H1M3-3]
MNSYVDTHAHIYADEFKIDLIDLLHRCDEQHVNKIFMPNVDHTSIDKMMEVEYRWPKQCFAMMGLHPCSVKKDFERELYIVEEWLAKRKFSAVGEIGTDLYWDKSFWDQQQEALIIQVNWAKKYNLPIVLHCRESLDQTIEVIEKLQDGKLKGIFHCFSGTVEQAQRIFKLGFYIGIGGVVTFKNGGLDKVLPEIDLAHVVLETDSPYLAPVPYRGKRNEPTYLPLISSKISEIMKCTVEEVQKVTTQNALNIFQHTL